MEVLNNWKKLSQTIFDSISEVTESAVLTENYMESLKTISITLLDKNSLKINKSRFNNNLYGVNRIDNNWTTTEVDTILNSIKGSWETDEYIGFVDSGIYYPDLFDPDDNLETNIKDKLYNEYQLKKEHAESNIPNLNFSVRLLDGKEIDSNYIYVNKYYPSPISIILSENRG